MEYSRRYYDRMKMVRENYLRPIIMKLIHEALADLGLISASEGAKIIRLDRR